MLWSRFPFVNAAGSTGLDRLHEQVNRLFDRYTRHDARYPLVNLYANDEQVLVEAELPGIDPTTLDVTVAGNMLTVKGERVADESIKSEQYQRRERGAGAFSRSFELPYEVEADKVDAAYRRGVLKLTLPRQEASKPRKITVNG